MFLPIYRIIRRFVLSRKTYDDVNLYSLLIYHFGCDFLHLIYFPRRAVCIFSVQRAVDFSIFLKASSIVYLCLTLILFITGAYHYEYHGYMRIEFAFATKVVSQVSQIAKFKGPTCWPHDPCYQGCFTLTIVLIAFTFLWNCRFIVTDFGSMPPDFVLMSATLCMEAYIINFGKMWRITVTS